MNYLYIDTEFSSFYSGDRSKSGELLQVALVPVIGGIQQNVFNEYCKPLTSMWNSRAEDVHKIERNFALLQQHPSELCDKMVKFIKQFDCIFQMSGFKCLGDESYIKRLITDYNGSVDWTKHTRFEWRDIHKKVTEKQSHLGIKKTTLGDMCKYFSIEHNAHDALSDALVTKQVDEKLSAMFSYATKDQMQYNDLSNIEKRAKYIDRKYVQINHDGVYISENATSNAEAMKFIIEELWSVFVDGR